MKEISFVAMLSVLTLLHGCATITGSETQPVSLTTQTAEGQLASSVQCSLRNDKGAWTAVSPGFVNVTRSAEDLVIECRKQGIPDGFARAISRAHGGMFGNIIFGGGIGAIIDHSRGTGYEYPNTIPVRMGRSIVVDRADQGQIKEEPVPATAQPRANTTLPPPTQQHSPPTASPADSPKAEASSMLEIVNQRPSGIERPIDDQAMLPKPPKIPAMSFEVEKLARAQGCNTSKGAELLTEPGPVETFRVRCDGGGELTLRCEFRACRILN